MPVPYSFVEGSPGVTLDDVAHVMLPGRYRSANGMGSSDLTIRRVDTGANLYIDNELATDGGVIVASGYKNPGDHVGEPWRDALGEEFEGVPEAYSMRTRLLGYWSISDVGIRVDPHSIDTVTNFTNTQELYPDERPVAIAAQAEHLARILEVIAPRTMRRPYVGLVVPELPTQPDKDGLGPRLVSRWVVRGITPETPNAPRIADARIRNVWRVVATAQSLSHPFSSRQAREQA